VELETYYDNVRRAVLRCLEFNALPFLWVELSVIFRH